MLTKVSFLALEKPNYEFTNVRRNRASLGEEGEEEEGEGNEKKEEEACEEEEAVEEEKCDGGEHLRQHKTNASIFYVLNEWTRNS